VRSLALLSCLAVGCGGVRPLAAPAVFPLKPAWTTPVSDFVEGALATDRNRLFAITRDGIVRAFDPASGQVLWQSEQSSGTLAASEAGVILRLVDGTVKSLAPARGTVRWEAASGIVGDLPPVLDGDHAFIAGKGMAALDIATGRVLWSAPSDPTVTAPPVAAGSRLLAGEEDGTLRCRDRASGVSLWKLRTGSALLAPPVVDPERRRLYLGTTDRRLLEVGLEKGKKGWAWKVGADVESPGLIHERRVLFTAFDAVLYALNRGNGNLVWRAPLPSRPLSGPLLAGATVLVACHEKDVIGFDVKTGRPVGNLRTIALIGTPPLLIGGRLFVGLRDRSVVGFELAGFSSTLAPSERSAPAPLPPQ
jgi:outer membrane protein assembly factor BamB